MTGEQLGYFLVGLFTGMSLMMLVWSLHELKKEDE